MKQDASRFSDPKMSDLKSPDSESADDESSGVSVMNDREEQIAIIAYYKAERRGFANSGELDDWLSAERELEELERTRHKSG